MKHYVVLHLWLMATKVNNDHSFECLRNDKNIKESGAPESKHITCNLLCCSCKYKSDDRSNSKIATYPLSYVIHIFDKGKSHGGVC